jgi:hypothetical protein
VISLKRSTIVGRLVLATAVVVAGCNAANPNPSPGGFCLGEGEGIIAVYRWTNGPVVVICGDAGPAMSTGENFSGPPSVRKEHGSASAKDGRKFDWFLESADGKSIKCRVAGKDFDLSNGALFLVRTRGGKVEVEQVKRDLSAVQPTAESCKEFAAKNPDVAKLLAKEGEK